MSQSSGNSPIHRVVSWLKDRFGSGQAASPGRAGTASGSSTPRPASTAASEASQPPAAAASTKDRVDEINAGLRENARKLARPMESSADDDLSSTTDRPGDMGEEPTAPADEGQPTGASTDEFTGGGYTPDPVSADDVERAAEGDGTPTEDNILQNAVVPSIAGANTASDESMDAQDPSTESGPGEAAASDESLLPQGEYAQQEDGTWSITGTDEPSGATAAAEAASPTGQDSAPGSTYRSTATDAEATSNYAAVGTDTPEPGDPHGSGTYAATPGDIAVEGVTTERDLGLAGDGDLNASELGALENAEEDRFSRDLQQEQTEYGERKGADLSKTGLYASIRGDEGESSESGNSAWDEPATQADPSVSVTSGASSIDRVTVHVETAASVESDVQAPAVAMDTGRDASTRVDDGPGNTAMTAGDDYSSERAAEELQGADVVSTTSADIGEDMPSGEQSDDLVWEPPVPDQPTGVAVQAKPVDEGATGAGGYAGAVRGDGTTETPPGYPIKGNASSKIYHTPEMSSYAGTKPQWCFATTEDAERAGFRAPRQRNQRNDG